MICYSVSQRTKIIWLFAETKSIKLTQQKFKEHFNVARAPRKPTILSLVDKCLTTGSEMLESLILTFQRKELQMPSFFDMFVFSCDKHSCKAKGYLSLDK